MISMCCPRLLRRVAFSAQPVAAGAEGCSLGCRRTAQSTMPASEHSAPDTPAAEGLEEHILQQGRDGAEHAATAADEDGVNRVPSCILKQLGESYELISTIINGEHEPGSTEAHLQSVLQNLKQHLASEQDETAPRDQVSSSAAEGGSNAGQVQVPLEQAHGQQLAPSSMNGAAAAPLDQLEDATMHPDHRASVRDQHVYVSVPGGWQPVSLQ